MRLRIRHQRWIFVWEIPKISAIWIMFVTRKPPNNLNRLWKYLTHSKCKNTNTYRSRRLIILYFLKQCQMALEHPIVVFMNIRDERTNKYLSIIIRYHQNLLRIKQQYEKAWNYKTFILYIKAINFRWNVNYTKQSSKCRYFQWCRPINYYLTNRNTWTIVDDECYSFPEVRF